MNFQLNLEQILMHSNVFAIFANIAFNWNLAFADKGQVDRLRILWY